MNDNDTNRVLAIMDEINTVPRQSNHLEKIHPWIMDWGRRHGFDVKNRLDQERPHYRARYPGL
jgi:di/tripeptidase